MEALLIEICTSDDAMESLESMGIDILLLIARNPWPAYLRLAAVLAPALLDSIRCGPHGRLPAQRARLRRRMEQPSWVEEGEQRQVAICYECSSRRVSMGQPLLVRHSQVTHLALSPGPPQVDV